MKTFSRKDSRLDTFWMKLIDIFERGFSVNENYLVKNQSEDRVIGIRIVHDNIRVAGSVTDIPITKNLINDVHSFRYKSTSELVLRRNRNRS